MKCIPLIILLIALSLFAVTSDTAETIYWPVGL
jgi:hypothetical protein